MDFYLIYGSTKGETLVNFLLEVIDACHNAGLVVVATVFDMGANSGKALKQSDVSEKTPFFWFHNRDIAAGFDPPHPLKCTCNCFLKHDVTNVWLDVAVNGQ